MLKAAREENQTKEWKGEWKMEKDYVEGVVGELRKILGSGYTVSTNEVLKNNGVKKCGIAIRKDGDNVGQNFYLEDIVGADEETARCDEKDAARLIAEAYREHSDNSTAGIIGKEARCMNKEKILDSVYYGMVNRKKNESILENSPHIPFLDIAATFRVGVSSEEDMQASFLVSRDICDTYGIKIHELYEAAMKNTETCGFTCMSIAKMMAEITGLPVDAFVFYELANQLYVLTNSSGVYGASVLMYTQYFRELAESIGDDLFVLPSSVHEVIAVPAGSMEPGKLRNTVCEINANEVKAEEFLSNNVYLYRKDEDQLSVAEK